MSKKEEVEKLVEFALRTWTGIERTEQGNWEGRRGSTFMRIVVSDDGEKISVLSPMGFDIPRSGELAWAVLEINRLATVPAIVWPALSGDPSRCNVWRKYSRFTEGLDAEEIETLVSIVSASADDDDDDFIARFGGRVGVENEGGTQ